MTAPFNAQSFNCPLMNKNIPKVTKPIWLMDEYATSFFISVCTSATMPIYTTAIRLNTMMTGAK